MESCHIIFEDDYLKKIKKSQYEPDKIWELNTDTNKEYKLGGLIENCDINNLLSFDSIPENINIKSLHQVKFGMNFEHFFNAQIDDKILSYQHDKNGTPKLLTQNINIEFPYSNLPIEETRIKLAKTPINFLEQEWEGNCNKIGGNPIWIQEKEDLNCPKCGEKMNFTFQLDSGLPDKNPKNDYEIMFGNDGICYAFWCDDDKISSFIWQSS